MFTPEEIQILLNGIELWEAEQINSAFLTGMIASMVEPDLQLAKENLESKLAEAREVSQQRKIRAIRLKAKLLDLADNDAVSSATRFLSGEE